MKHQSAVTFGINSQTLVGADLPSCIHLAEQHGFSALEITGGLLDEIGVAVARDALDGAPVELLGVSPTESVLHWHNPFDEDLRAELFRQMERAAALGARYFVLPFMKSPDPGHSVQSSLIRAVEYAEKIQIDLALESIGHVDAYRRVEDLVALITSTDSKRVGILLDSFHFFRAAHTMDDLELLNGMPIHALQISNSNALPLDQLLGYRDRTFPLDGPFPVLEMVEQVLRNRPSTPVVVEIIGDEANSRPAEESAKLAREHIQRIEGQLREKEQTNV